MSKYSVDGWRISPNRYEYLRACCGFPELCSLNCLTFSSLLRTSHSHEEELQGRQPTKDQRSVPFINPRRVNGSNDGVILGIRDSASFHVYR